MRTLLILILILTIPSLALSWTETANFDSGAVGQVANGSDGFDGAGTATLYSDTYAHSGTQSARMTWLTGDAGFDENHGVNYLSSVTDGGEIWARVYYYFPTGFDFTCTPVNKILRLHVYASDGSTNRGHISIFSGSAGQVKYSNEVDATEPYTGESFGTGSWDSYELYVRFSTTSPISRIWKNGILIHEDTTHATLQSATDISTESYVMSYWNGGPDQDQYSYHDDLYVTNEQPSNQDAAGNYMIGPTDWGAHGAVLQSSGAGSVLQSSGAGSVLQN